MIMTNRFVLSPLCALLYGLIHEYSQKISTNASHFGFIKLRLLSPVMAVALCCRISQPFPCINLTRHPPPLPCRICTRLLQRQVQQVYCGPVPGCNNRSPPTAEA